MFGWFARICKVVSLVVSQITKQSNWLVGVQNIISMASSNSKLKGLTKKDD